MKRAHERQRRGPLYAAVPLLLTLTPVPLRAQRAQEQTVPASAVAPARAAYRPVFVKLRTGAEVPVWNELRQPVGSMYDLVVEHASGRVVAAVLDLGAADALDLKLVPYDRLTWIGDRQRFVLPLDPEALAALPPFRVEELQVIEDDGSLPPALAAGAETAAPRPGTRRPVRNLLAAELRGVRVSAEEVGFGKIAYLVLEPEHGLVSFVSVRPDARLSAGPSPYVVPWTALHRQKEGDFTLELDLTTLRNGPVLSRGLEALRDDAFRTEAFRYYGLEPYRFDALHDDESYTSG